MQAWHHLILGVSALASVIGLVILVRTEATPSVMKLVGQGAELDEFTAHSETLLRMIFVYWLLFCISSTLQKLTCLAGTDLQAMCQITQVITYLLTFSSLLCYPMHLFQARQTRQQVKS
ncbi:hypothetical protein [Synechococcus sp. PCC 6312]|uniref:hypothetical protein n=1 Tax=Synechococcus sp. (strain ATCC 27167 / PCC 6312) TaxID=195253 RepID=UPI00029EF84D|nr:hypothetical protein [Synechococcus sp. PCC 6312]AFY59619.1 hypothetical protein Syn6312_0388 [Synechococcus sp. PCC 6312]